MIVHTAKFTGSYPRADDCPTPDRPEYAFIGRSNVGKSSLINMLTGHTKLAKTSQTPGKTQLINFFLINHGHKRGDLGWYLVDLPGFGYAKVSKSSRRQWEQMIRRYLVLRPSLQCVMMLIDIRVPPQENDLTFMHWLGEMHIPFVMAFTKADKLKPGAVDHALKAYTEKMLESWEEMPRAFITSATKGQGREDILAFIDEVNANFISPV